MLISKREWMLPEVVTGQLLCMNWRPLAEQRNADAQYLLGAMYDNGLGVPQHCKTTVKWYTLAAEQGDASAQYNLGWTYDNGRGVPQD